jgi:hypothetical protein
MMMMMHRNCKSEIHKAKVLAFLLHTQADMGNKQGNVSKGSDK